MNLLNGSYNDGTMILDLNPAAALACNITGPDTSTTPLLAGSNVYSFPVDCTVPLSTAFGSIGAAMPQSNKGFTSTAAFSVELGPSSSAFVTGTATLAGDSSPERVSITAGAVTSGTPRVQQVTITYRWPNAAGGGTSLWQGGLDTMAISLDRNLARDGWPQAFAAVGAIGSSHIGYTINSEGSTYNNTLSYYLGPMQIVAISRNSSGLVTFLSNNVGAYSMQSAITIAGSGTTPSMDGACTNVKPLVNGAGNINGGTCQEATASAVTGTTATATIPGVNGIHLYPYADNIGPMVAGALHLGPNTVNWQPGDAIENPAYPIAQFTGLSLGVSMNTPTAASPSIGLDLQEHGSGTAAYYSSIRIGNYLPCSWLASCGGTLFPKTNVSIFGAYLTHENL